MRRPTETSDKKTPENWIVESRQKNQKQNSYKNVEMSAQFIKSALSSVLRLPFRIRIKEKKPFHSNRNSLCIIWIFFRFIKKSYQIKSCLSSECQFKLMSERKPYHAYICYLRAHESHIICITYNSIKFANDHRACLLVLSTNENSIFERHSNIQFDELHTHTHAYERTENVRLSQIYNKQIVAFYWHQALIEHVIDNKLCCSNDLCAQNCNA